MTLIDELTSRILARAGRDRPMIVGIAGPVAVGKTTLTEELVAALDQGGSSASTLSADAYLLPNDELGRRGLLMQKGFPETFDLPGLRAAVETLRGGDSPSIPVYSHERYDRVPDAAAVVSAAPVVIVEGVVVLNAAVADLLDLAVYIDAVEADIVEWFTGRFLAWRELARAGDVGTFYATFAGLDDDECRGLACSIWDGINGVNLRDHIAPSRANADVVVRKGPRHEYVALDAGPRAPFAAPEQT